MRKTLERLWGKAKGEREFDALEHERLKTDQLTEASERLNGAMENEFEYSHKNGDFYFQGQALKPIFDGGIRAAEEIVKTRPWFMIELQRRHIERQQLNEQIELIQNVDWQNPLVLVHISPTPDAVLKDEVDLNAYDKERKKIMIRITEPTLDGVKVTSMSLDGNDRVALQAVGDFFGIAISDDASSEDILGMHFLAEKSQFGGERPAKVLRERYDKTMQAQYGGEWYAGRQDSEVLGTMQRILAYPELLEQHVDEIARLKKNLGKNFRFTKEYERATYNFLAAIEQAGKLGAVVGSLADAGSLARAAGVEFAKSDCPTASQLTAEQALEVQGLGKERWMGCPDCGKKDACYGDPCAFRLDCRFCGAYVEGGVMHKGIGRAAVEEKLRSRAQEKAKTNTEAVSAPRNHDAEFRAIIEQQYGAGAVAEVHVEVGTARTDIIGRGGEVLASGVKLGQLALASK